jgi:hypothetical protein
MNSTKKFTRAVAIAALAAVPVVGLSAAPAGAKTVSPQKWATGFCTALSDWQDTIQGASSDVSSALADTTDLAAGKTTLVDFLSQAIDATDTAISDAKATGVPDTTNGAKIQAALIKGFGKAKSIFQKAEADAEKLSTTDAASFSTKATEIGQEIQDSASEIDTAFGKIDKLDKGGKLDKVVKANKACAFLG